MDSMVNIAKEIAYRQDHMETLTAEGRRLFFFPLLKEAGLLHLYTSRDMNLRISGRESDPGLLADWALARSLIGKEYREYYYMAQVHSNQVDAVDEEGLGVFHLQGRRISRDDGPDGLMTKRADFLLSSSYGDCAPILFWDRHRRVQANVHSGWKGTLHQIAGNAVRGLSERYGSNPRELVVAIGPHIGRADFEVNEDVAAPFRTAFPELPGLVTPHPDPGKEEKSRVDLNLCIAYVLLKSGVLPENILNCGRSTVAHPEDYHSFRRDKDAFGLMMVFSQIR